MNLDELPGQFEAFTDRARGVLNQHIAEARDAVTAANNEKSSAQNALVNLQAQVSQTQTQLDALLAHLGRASELASIDSEVATARTELQRLTAEKVALEVSIAGLAKQRSEAESRVNALQSEAQRWIAIRSEGEAVMNGLRAQLRSVQIGQQS